MAASVISQDVIFNRSSVALAKSRLLLQSWLPSPPSEELPAILRSDSDLEREEEEMFKPVPDLLGLGAAPPPVLPDGSFQRQQLGSNDALRKQLLKPHEYRKYGLVEKRNGGLSSLAGSKPKPVEPKRHPGDEVEDEEGGRTAVGRGKRKRVKASEDTTLENIGIGLDGSEKVNPEYMLVPDPCGIAAQETSFSTIKPKKTTGSYLDELLHQKARKSTKNKKNKKKKKSKGPVVD